MKTTTYATDLQILPETDEEKERIIEYCKINKLSYRFYFSDVKEQEWYGKRFIEIPFRSDLREDFLKMFN